ncbi:MAG: right-handed parallel beta-helix repeat-containing protein, partial [Synergistaceae bacterium]|nr:right-handed parallel beta-helix repeat-containing protein [Synergistaceae bacterium]
TLNNNGGCGIYYGNANGTLTLEKSTITSNHEYGVRVWSQNTTITNCTIANNAQQGIYCNTSGSVKVVNSTIVNNTMQPGSLIPAEIYFSDTAPSFDITNTLIWNDSVDEVFYKSNSANPTVTFTNSAYPNGAKKDYVTSSDKDINITWANIVSADETVKGVKHTFYSLKNNSVLSALRGAGVEGQVSEDQLGRVRAAAPTIGAIETEITGISAVVSPDNYTTELKPESDDEKTFTVTVKGFFDGDETTENEISSGYTTAWSLSKSIDGITIDNDGVLKIANTLSAGTHELKVIATVTHAASGLTASDDAVITITKEEAENASPKLISLDVTLSASPTTLSLDAGEAGEIVVTPTVKATYDDSSTETLTSGYEITWTSSPSVDGITLTSGTLNVTSSTKAGSYEIKITATVTSGDVKNSADTSVTINVNEVSTPSNPENPENPENPSNPEKENENGNGQKETVYKTVDTQTADGIKNLSDDAKAALIDLTLTGNITDLTMIDSKFVNLKIVNLSKVTSLETADLSQLPASVESVDISNNVDVKIIKLTATTKIKNVIANGCKKLEELDLAENPNIEVIDVSETVLKEINAANCENLMTLICSSCDIDQTGLILTGCAKLVYLDFSNNSFLIFDYSATDTPILETLKCEGQNKAVDNIPSEFNFAIFM